MENAIIIGNILTGLVKFLAVCFFLVNALVSFDSDDNMLGVLLSSICIILILK